jgi:hypothetical protein
MKMTWPVWYLPLQLPTMLLSLACIPDCLAKDNELGLRSPYPRPLPGANEPKKVKCLMRNIPHYLGKNNSLTIFIEVQAINLIVSF